jgi:hypothetical protein
MIIRAKLHTKQWNKEWVRATLYDEWQRRVPQVSNCCSDVIKYKSRPGQATGTSLMGGADKGSRVRQT